MSSRTLQALYIVDCGKCLDGFVRVISIADRRTGKTIAATEAPTVYDELVKLCAAVEVAEARANLAVRERDDAQREVARLKNAVAELQDALVDKAEAVQLADESEAA